MAAQTPLTRALDTIRELRAQLAAGRGPIGVVGAGLRLPGGIHDLDTYWEALAVGKDLVQAMPEHRRERFAEQWRALPHRGGFLDEVLEFDAEFFGMRRREAARLDPQHRLLLEVAWEALENAALPPDRLGGLRVGVYVGISNDDYRDWSGTDPDAFWATGNGGCFAAGRIAYTLDLTGPTMAVDTACSSSLVAIHLAAQALRHGECDIALAGGVNLILSPRSTEIIRRTRSLSPDGVCRPFDARANGFTRGEGCGVVVLKRLDEATRDGDRVHAVLHGSAVNQDGRSTGLTAPNVRSQIALIEAALADAGRTPADIGLVEAHGTGTSLGDPIEMDSIVAALGRPANGHTVHVGSVKANLGHLEAAAGVTSVLKAILCLRHRIVPPLVHFQTLNPRMDLDGTRITVSGLPAGWHPDAGTCAGVSSFGMSGTNAHVILGPAEPSRREDAGDLAVPGFELSARSAQALRALARRFAGRLAELGPEDYAAFAYTVTGGRARHRLRAQVTAPDRTAAIAALTALAEDAESAAVTLTERDHGPAGEAFAMLPRRVIDLPHYPWERHRLAP